LQPVYTISNSILSPLGNTSEECFDTVMNGTAAIKRYEDNSITSQPFYAGRLAPDQLQMLQSRYGSGKDMLSPFEQMCIYAMQEALSKTEINPESEDCIFILSSTKGNIEWLGQQSEERISLFHSAKLIAAFFNMKHKPIVVSNACISGSLALIMASRMMASGKCKHTIVVGCDRFSSFVFSGFQSFHALADGLCKPFDMDRNGINLGEAAACMILSVDKHAGLEQPLVILSGGGISNDANHLSGPSRTGAELSGAVDQAIKQAGITPEDIGMISAHGTATAFNDEMEAKALNLSGVSRVPLHSLKSYVGHTLGAAGIIESIIACMAMQQDLLPASLGYEHSGVSEPVNVLQQPLQQAYNYVLKTASGFGGCNAALVWKKA
jgi:3-oxoacyl-[acyl-carrier-protein] synthase-1